jgi:hypothetical protein
MKLEPLFLFMILLIITSCQKRSYNPDGNGDVFNVELDIKIKNDEELILFYKDGSNEWFIDSKTIAVSLKGSDDFQKVVFKFPNDILPNDMRLDIGTNEFKNQTHIEIKKFTLVYFDKRFEISGKKFITYFRGNQYIQYNEENMRFYLIKDPQGNYDPFFETKADFFPELIRLVKQ